MCIRVKRIEGNITLYAFAPHACNKLVSFSPFFSLLFLNVLMENNADEKKYSKAIYTNMKQRE